MKQKRIGIIMHGVTGRMGMNQHLIRSILAIREQGGVALADGTRADARPILSSAATPTRSKRCAKATASTRWTDRSRRGARQPRRQHLLRRRLDAAAADAARARRSRAGKHVYCEKPIADEAATTQSRSRGLPRTRASRTASCRTSSGLPGLLKLKRLRRQRLLRPHPLGARRVRLLGVRGRLEAGAAAVAGTTARKTAAASSSTCCCHWRYVLDNLFGDGEGGDLPRRHPHPGALGRARASATRPPPTTRPTPPSCSRAAVVAQINSVLVHARAARRPA